MSYVAVESPQRGPRIGFDNSAVAIVAGKSMNRFHRIPHCQYFYVDRITFAAAAQNHRAAESPDLPERRQYATAEMRKVSRRVCRHGLPSADDHFGTPQKNAASRGTIISVKALKARNVYTLFGIHLGAPNTNRATATHLLRCRFRRCWAKIKHPQDLASMRRWLCCGARQTSRVY